ncbi:MAG TPA: NADH-quinone oxidoreductase subunit M [Anaerolineae bacterium]|nr:NADH-quinone oxidoreductase subunit M [Anaerolineae bacterium]
MQFPFLTVITFTPIVAAVILLLLPRDKTTLIKLIALIAVLITLVMGIIIFVQYDQSAALADPANQFQFVEQTPWVESLGISYKVGADGINLPMILLTGIVAVGGVMISWGITDRTREFFAFFMLLVAGVYGVFVALDLFLLFFFYELSIFPMYILIATWGSTRKEYAAMKLTLYLLIGSIIALVGILAIYFSATTPDGARTFDLTALKQSNIPIDVARIWFLPIFLGFGVLAGIWPFHSWSPDGHVAAPTAVSMIHAGVLMKLGAYAALRVGVELLPQAAREFLPFIVLLVMVNVVYGAAIAMVQRDFKYVIGFSSVSHMGLVTMGFATMNQVGLNGAVLQMFSHGVMTALFFTIVGLVYDRAHTRDIPQLGGMIKVLPWAAIAFVIGGLVSMGMPGLSGFVAELQIFMGVWVARDVAPWYPIVALVSALGIVLTAAYVLRVAGQVFFGQYDEHRWHDMRPANILDKTTIAMFCVILIAVGVFPLLLMNMINTGTTSLVNLLAGG